MTSTFLRVAPGWPVAKVSFSSQEWCGHVWHQIVPRDGKLGGIFHSYFDGEADGADEPVLPEGRSARGRAAGPPAWLERRLPQAGGEPRGAIPAEPAVGAPNHRPLAWTTARIARAARRAFRHRPGRSLRGDRLHGETADGRKLGFDIESAPPFRLIRQTGPDGEELALKGSTRLPYWRLNAPGGERHLKELGLR